MSISSPLTLGRMGEIEQNIHKIMTLSLKFVFMPALIISPSTNVTKFCISNRHFLDLSLKDAHALLSCVCVNDVVLIMNFPAFSRYPCPLTSRQHVFPVSHTLIAFPENGICLLCQVSPCIHSLTTVWTWNKINLDQGQLQSPWDLCLHFKGKSSLQASSFYPFLFSSAWSSMMANTSELTLD